MKQIPLKQGGFTLVDDDNFEYINQKRCRVGSSGYVFTGKNTRIHRLITNCPDDMVVDHINHNKLDNRKQNLRICTIEENCRNRVDNKNNKSGFRGVSFYLPLNKWRAKIVLKNKTVHLGYFNTPQEASQVYEKVAKRNGFLKGVLF